MKKHKSVLILLILFSFLCISFFILKNRHKIKNRISFYFGYVKNRLTKSGMTNCENCNDLFDDGIAAHEKAYRIEKINPQATDEDLKRLGRKGILKSIETNDFYLVDDFSHSQPLLLPKAVSFLNELSMTYQDKCNEMNCSYKPFLITSGTRSNQSVKRLMKKSTYAIKHSAHLKGKTFDISYAAFENNNQQLKIFVSVLSAMKNKDKCLVKYERNGCLHITVN